MKHDPSLLFTLKVPVNGKFIVINAYDGNSPMTESHHRIDVEVRFGGETVFERGRLYCGVNQWTCVDSDVAKELVLSLVAMRPGDTDADYFADYTPEQLEFAERYSDDITVARELRYGDTGS